MAFIANDLVSEQRNSKACGRIKARPLTNPSGRRTDHYGVIKQLTAQRRWPAIVRLRHIIQPEDDASPRPAANRLSRSVAARQAVAAQFARLLCPRALHPVRQLISPRPPLKSFRSHNSSFLRCCSSVTNLRYHNESCQAWSSHCNNSFSSRAGSPACLCLVYVS